MCNILIAFHMYMKLVKLIKFCLNKAYSKFSIGKHLSDKFPIQNSLNQGDTWSPFLFEFDLEYTFRKVQENQMTLKTEEDTPASGVW